MPDDLPGSEPSPARQALAHAGLTPSSDELAMFDMMYGILRARANVVHSIELGYEV
jgi:hypothetical protein